MNTTSRLDADTVRTAARHHWTDTIYPMLNINVGNNGKPCACPLCGGKDRFFCDDKDGSGSWFCRQCDLKAGDGFALVMKIRSCDFPTALALVAEALGHHSGNGDRPRKIVATYDYTNEAGTLLYQVVRYQPKTFRQRRPDGQGGWIWNLEGIEPVLYKLPAVLQVDQILILEGEKDVETAYRLGLPDGWAATCNPMGAEKWRESYSDTLQGKQVVIVPDADERGQKHTEKAGRSLAGKAKRVDLLSLPAGFHDLSEWATGKTGADLASLLEFVSYVPIRQGGSNESNFRPITASDLLAQPPEEVDWVQDEILPVGGLVLIAGKPKEGKTTLAYELAVKVALGLPFLGRQTRQASVLILALEEHARDVGIRLRNLGATTLDNLYVHVGPSAPTPTVLASIMTFTKEHEVKFIIVDTLSAWWKIENENDAAEMTKVIKPLLQLARASGACVLLIHHARKSEGSYGDEIRGSGALFAAVDVAIVIKRHEIHTQRLLQFQSRYPETPSELVIELRDSGYVALGDPASTGKAAKLAKLASALADDWEDADIIAKRAGLSRWERYRLLGILVKEGKALQDGKGVKNSPFRFRRHSIRLTPPPIGPDTKTNGAPSMQCDSSDPPSPQTNGIGDAPPGEATNEPGNELNGLTELTELTVDDGDAVDAGPA